MLCLLFQAIDTTTSRIKTYSEASTILLLIVLFDCCLLIAGLLQSRSSPGVRLKWRLCSNQCQAALRMQMGLQQRSRGPLHLHAVQQLLWMGGCFMSCLFMRSSHCMWMYQRYR